MDSNQFDESLNAQGLRLALAVSRFNEAITEKLLDGALEALDRAGADEDRLTVERVPGAWELPLIAQALAGSGDYDAVICLGAVIRGDTPHFDYVAGECARGLQQVQIGSGVPVVFGVLTTDTVEQAEERSGGKHGNKGADAALTAIEMARLMERLRGGD
jgi:6,7-dimethyl-8-ribityllumazine synthase